MIGSDELVPMLADPTSGLTITPLIDAAGQIGNGSVDIRLGPDIIVSPKAMGAVAFDPMNTVGFKRNLDQNQQYIRRGIGDPFPIQPGEFVIARSLEYITLPENVSAEALGRSSWGRLGLVIATATLIQPGFKGTITLELANIGDTPIVLEVGLAIAQLVFSRESPPRAAKFLIRQKSGLGRSERKRVERWRERHKRISAGKGRYHLQIKPAHSRLHEDQDFIWVTPIAVRYAVGVVGERYSGKSTVVDFLVSRRHFRLYRLSQVIYDEVKRRGEDTTSREVMRRVGDEMRAEQGEAILAQRTFERIRADLLDPEGSKSLEPVVITGFRHPAELRAWEKLEVFRPVVVEADVRKRRENASRGGYLEQMKGYPISGTEQEQDEWFEYTIDRVHWDGWKSAEKPLAIKNNFETVTELQDHLKQLVTELEQEWRAREY